MNESYFESLIDSMTAQTLQTIESNDRQLFGSALTSKHRLLSKAVKS